MAILRDTGRVGDADDASALIAAWRAGDQKAGDRLFSAISDELHLIASRLLKHERSDISLATGDLANEAVARLLDAKSLDIVDRAHLLALCARIMRHTLLDAARRRNRDKRKGVNVTMTDAHAPAGCRQINLLALDQALRRLHAIEPEYASIAEMRYFAGMTVDEIAAATAISPATVKRRWETARLWLQQALEYDLSAEGN